MRDIRITVRGEDFPAVSEKMIALGVAFQVEPLGGDEETQRPAATARPVAARKKPAKKAGAERGSAPSGNGPAEAAARLRAMAERNRAAGTRPADEPIETPRSTPFDTES